MASVGSILGGTFRVFRERPVAVAVWFVIFAVIGIGTQFLTRGQTTVANAGAPPFSPGGMFAVLGGVMLLVIVIYALFYAVMYCAAYRAVLRPDQSSFAYLRVGMDELRMIGLGLLMFVAMLLFGLLATLLYSVVLGGVFAVTGGGAMTAIIVIISFLAILCGWIFLWVRLSLIFPLTFARRRMAIDEAWSLTRGNFWTLFLVYFVIFVIWLVLILVVAGSAMAPYLAMFAQGFRNPEAMRQMQEAQMAQQMNLSLVSIVLTGLLNAATGTITLVLGCASTAVATRELLLDDGEVLEEDAERTAAIFE